MWNRPNSSTATDRARCNKLAPISVPTAASPAPAVALPPRLPSTAGRNPMPMLTTDGAISATPASEGVNRGLCKHTLTIWALAVHGSSLQ